MSPIDSKTGRILLVEDDPGYQELMETMLRKTYQVTICSSAEAALEKLVHERFDLVISDINLLGLTGFEVLGRIKAAGPGKECPVVLSSSNHDQFIREKALVMGAAHFIPKPFDPQTVQDLVSKLIGARR
ncbi:MAG: response regulator [Elusimicrobia bacterium]|nr:response regulator [Elusimicrobiota bacterium]